MVLSSISGGLNRKEFDKLISTLGKRVFILHNVHSKKPEIFQTRWAMNYLAGPLTRAQIPLLNNLAGANEKAESAPLPNSSAVTNKSSQSLVSGTAAVTQAKCSQTSAGSTTKPTPPAGVDEYFLPLSFSLTEAFNSSAESIPPESQLAAVLYRPVLLASAKSRILDRRYGIDTEIATPVLVDDPDKNGAIKWDDFLYQGPSLERLESSPAPQAMFESISLPFTDAKTIAAMNRDFADWVYRTVKIPCSGKQTAEGGRPSRHVPGRVHDRVHQCSPFRSRS